MLNKKKETLFQFYTHLPYNGVFVVVEMGADGREYPRPQPQGIDVKNQSIHPGLEKKPTE